MDATFTRVITTRWRGGGRMGEILLDLSERALVAAIERNLAELHVFMAGWPEITAHRAPDLLWTLSRRKFSLCNVVLDVRLACIAGW